jgi:DNA-binding NtrC family response regulator
MSENGRGKVLLVDDEPNAVKVLSAILTQAGYEVLESWDVDGSVRVIGREEIDAVITDLKMPGRDGIELFGYIKENNPDIPVIFLTAYGTVESAVDAMTDGAFHYLIKPPDHEKLKDVLEKAVELRRLKREIERLKRRLATGGELPIIGQTPAMTRIFETIHAIMDSESTVLICGETGTGKELVARSLHYSSERKDKPFVAVNCAAIPRDLLESELFGYERGAFTGAVTNRVGKFEEAGQGTILLDEIGELDPGLQAKLLRVIENREVERLGSNRKISLTARLVFSTNRDLEAEVRKGAFREDLYYRINVIRIPILPLRERKDDLRLLMSQFVNEFCIRENKILKVSDEVREVLQEYHWPGNIRQLRNVIERAVVLARGEYVTVRELPEDIFSVPGREDPRVERKAAGTLREMEREAVREALRSSGGNKSKAARMLGISRKAFYKRLTEVE